jgi:hypothetical protein
MTGDPEVESHARQIVWNFLLDRQSSHGRQRCYLVSYPRSGSTLVRDYFAILQGRPQLSIYAGDVTPSSRRASTPCVAHIDMIKSHRLPADDYPVIYLVRDGRNATLSWLYMSFLFGGHSFRKLQDVHEAIQWIDNAEGCWSDHVAGALEQAQRRAILFVRYEDVVAAPESALEKMLGFLHVEISATAIANCVREQQVSERYAENPYNGFLDQPMEGSIYALLRRHRRGAYWRYILDERSRRYFHARGGTSHLLHFSYERSADWWKEGIAIGPHDPTIGAAAKRARVESRDREAPSIRRPCLSP